MGAALAFQRQKVARVSMAFLGDAATEEGVFHESMNFASLRGLPVVFFVENNFYSVYTALADRQPDRPLSAYAESHNMPSVVVDGNDVLAVRQVTKEMVARARSGKGPSLIIATTYRWREHCGPNYDNDIGYRTEEEFQEWIEKDPIRFCEREILGLSDSDIKKYHNEAGTIVKDAFEFAKNSSFPNQRMFFKLVIESTPWCTKSSYRFFYQC